MKLSHEPAYWRMKLVSEAAPNQICLLATITSHVSGRWCYKLRLIVVVIRTPGVGVTHTGVPRGPETWHKRD